MSEELEPQGEVGQVLCGNVAGDCVCVTPPDHDTPHVCECGGSWEWNADGTLNAVRLPGEFGDMDSGAVLSFLMGFPS